MKRTVDVSDEHEPTDDLIANDPDFVPSPFVRRPKPAGMHTVPGEWVALPILDEVATAPHDLASACRELLAKMSAQGHRAFIRYDL